MACTFMVFSAFHGNVASRWMCQHTLRRGRRCIVKNRLLRIHVEPIYSPKVIKAVDYVFKSLKNGNATPDDIQIYR